MKTEKQHLGNRGETLAAAFLEHNGHRIICRNYRSGRSELDIVSEEGDTVVISEVKSWQKPPLGAAEFRVHTHKQKMLIAGANGFLSAYPQYQDRPLRFDVLVVDFSHYPSQITWHKGAFYDDQAWGSF